MDNVNEDEKQAILDAINDGKYEVEYEPVNSFFEHTRYDGSKFYVMEDLDDAHSRTDMGSITFTVQTDEGAYDFIYDMNCGEWDGDNFYDDAEVQEALEELDEFIAYEDYDEDMQWEIFAKVNVIPEDAPHYWCEDDDCPKDVENLESYDVDVPLQFFIEMSHGACSDFMDMDCTMTAEDLFNLYKLMMKRGILDEELEEDEDMELPGEDFEKVYPELYNDIMKQVKDKTAEIGFDSGDGFLKFILLFPEDFFEENL